MNVQFPAPRRNWASLLLNLAVLVVVLAMAAATFVLSYSGVHAIVLQAGVSPRLARIYPGLFDAVFAGEQVNAQAGDHALIDFV